MDHECSQKGVGLRMEGCGVGNILGTKWTSVIMVSSRPNYMPLRVPDAKKHTRISHHHNITLSGTLSQ